mmetsp:Transcript_10770/g.22337  ORF Transcript_10770/g.22337 Transcript_10770/m.22337 type:complete len:97 (-) Transcript_10770:9-299(-)
MGLPGGKGGKKGSGVRQSVVKLHEIGPRLELVPVKIEEGVCDGKVLFHKYNTRSEKEVRQQDKEKKDAADLKRKRREAQERNVERKKKHSSKGEED